MNGPHKISQIEKEEYCMMTPIHGVLNSFQIHRKQSIRVRWVEEMGSVTQRIEVSNVLDE